MIYLGLQIEKKVVKRRQNFHMWVGNKFVFVKVDKQGTFSFLHCAQLTVLGTSPTGVCSP